MTVIQYTGTATVRKISKSDFESVGVPDQDDLVIDTTKRHLRSQADVSEMAAEYLVANDAFKMVDGEDVSPFFRQGQLFEDVDEDTDEDI